MINNTIYLFIFFFLNFIIWNNEYNKVDNYILFFIINSIININLFLYYFNYHYIKMFNYN